MTNNKLLLSALIGLSANSLPVYRGLQTQTNGVRTLFKHPSEVEGEKRRAQKAEIARWNAMVEARRTK